MWERNWGRSAVMVWAFLGAACSAGRTEPDGDARLERSGESLRTRALPLMPVVGPEIGTDAPTLVPTDLGHNPELATDGAGFLSVQEVNARIRAVRVDDAGRLLDADWLDFGADGVQQYYPSAAFGGGHYLVTWTEMVTDTDGNGTNTIHGRFAKADGSVEGDASFVVSSGQAIYSAVGWDGAHFVLAYVGLASDGSNAVESVLLNADGTRIAGSEHALASGSVSNPHLDVGDANTLVVWEEYADTSSVHGARVGRDGTPLDATPFALSAGTHGEQNPDVAAGATGYLVVWQTDEMAVHGSLVNDAGTVGAKDFSIGQGTDGEGLPSAEFDGTDYVVAWTDARDEQSLYGTHVSTSGAVGSEDVKLAPDAPRYVGFGSDRTNLAWNGSHLLLNYLGNSPNGIEGSLLTADLELVQGAIPLSAVPNSQGYPHNAFDGHDYVVTWADQLAPNSSEGSLRAQRVSGAGQPLDTPSIAISPSDAPAFGFELASARHDSTLFVWSGLDNMPRQRRMASDGSLSDVAPFVTENGAFVPSMASDGVAYLTAFNAGNSSDTGSVFGHLLGLDGSPGAEFRIDASTLNTGPFVFPTTGEYLVAYANNGMHLVTVSDTGTVGTVLDLTTNVSLVGGATSTTNTLVVWNDSDQAATLRGRFVEAGAFSGDAFELSADSAGYAAAVAWDGETYWAVWESATHDLLGRSIDTDGALGAVSTLLAGPYYAPVLASDGQGQMLLSYAKVVGEGRSYRVVSRLVGRGAGSSSGGAGGMGGTAGTAGMTSAGGASGSGGSAGLAAGGSNSTGAGGSSTSGGAGGAPGAGTSGSAANGGASAGMPGTGGTAVSGGAGGRGGSGNGGPPPIGCSVSRGGNGGPAAPLGLFVGLGAAIAALRRRSRGNR